MSDISSDNLPSSSDEEERRIKSYGIAQIPEVPKPLVPEQQAPKLESFWQANPLTDLVDLSVEELTNRLEWSQQIHGELEKVLKGLEKQYEAEWIAKERLLDELLRARIPNAPIIE